MMMRYLNFSEDFTEKILKGEKKATLRLGKKEYKEGEIVILRAGERKLGFARITKIRFLRLSDLKDKDIKMDGYAKKEDLIRALKKFYGELNGDEIFTQIVFEILH